METYQPELLTMPVQELSISDKLKYLLISCHYHTLGEVIKLNVSEMYNLIGITLHEELELYQLLKDNGLEDRWKDG